MSIYVGRVLAWSRPVSGRRQPEFGAATPTVGWRSSRAVQGRVLRGFSDPGRATGSRERQRCCTGLPGAVSWPARPDFRGKPIPWFCAPGPLTRYAVLAFSGAERPDAPRPMVVRLCSVGVPGAEAGHRPHLRHEGHAEGAARLQAPGAAAGHRRRSDAWLPFVSKSRVLRSGGAVQSRGPPGTEAGGAPPTVHPSCSAPCLTRRLMSAPARQHPSIATEGSLLNASAHPVSIVQPSGMMG